MSFEIQINGFKKKKSPMCLDLVLERYQSFLFRILLLATGTAQRDAHEKSIRLSCQEC